MKTTTILIGLAGIMATALVAAEVQNYATAATGGAVADLLPMDGDPLIDIHILQDRDGLHGIAKSGVLHRGPTDFATQRPALAP